MLRALERDKADPECRLLVQMLTGALGPHFVLSRCEFVEEMAETFADLSALVNAPTSPTDGIDFAEIPAHLPAVFPCKPQEHLVALEQKLGDERFAKERLRVSRIAANEPTAAEKELLHLLWVQQTEEIAAYEAAVRSALLDAALQSRRSKPQGPAGAERHVIKADDLRVKLKLVEPGKGPEDLAHAIYRGFRFASFSDTLAAINPSDSTGEDEDEDQGAYRAAMFTSQEPVEHVMVRLAHAGLMRPTLPDSYGAGSASARLLQRVRRRQCRLDALKSAASASPELGQSWQEASTTRILPAAGGYQLPLVAALLRQERSREKAVASALRACTDGATPHWARVPYIPDPVLTDASKSVLDLFVIQHQRAIGLHTAAAPAAAGAAVPTSPP